MKTSVRKGIPVLLAFVMVLSMAACAPGEDTGGSDSPMSDPGSAGNVLTDVDVSSGEKPMDEGLDFEGKTFRLALAYKPVNDVLERKVEAFNEKYNADVQFDKNTTLNWNEYGTELAAAKASGVPYDIIYYHMEFFPSLNVAGLLEPLEAYYTEADFYNPDQPEAGGLNPNLTASFNWDNKSYAVASANSVFPEVMYYNKLLIRDLGLEDPKDLYDKGEWTWDKMVEMGQEFLDPANGNFALSGFGDVSIWLAYNNVDGIAYDGTVPRQNLQDEKFIRVMNEYKNLYYGDNALCYSGKDYADSDLFDTGRVLFFVEQTDNYATRVNMARSSNAFGRDTSNLGIVPVPSKEGADLYPVHAPQGWGAGAGCSDPRVAVAFAKFESSWVDDNPPEDSLPVETKKLFTDLLNKGAYNNICGFQSNDGTTYMQLLNRQLGDAIRYGGDVAAVLTEYQNPVQKCIVDSTTK